MKEVLFIFLSFLLFGELSAKKVKFSVDMSGETISTNGVHITGDFQAAAGLGPNWDPGTATMVQEGTSSIYSIIVNIPAFKKYEYRFINGNLSYEAEYVPDESRVGYNFVDNRWIYVDSLANDTLVIGAIRYSKNAPAGKVLVRFKVDMTYAGNPSTGVHVGTSYQGGGFNPAKIRLYSFQDNVYEVINYVTAGTYSYLFYNGNTLALAETVPSSCATAGNRSITLPRDSVLPAYCFSSCAKCLGLGITYNRPDDENLEIYPNPASNDVWIKAASDDCGLIVTSALGKQYVSIDRLNENAFRLNVSGMVKGIYFVNMINRQGLSVSKKLVVE